MLRQFKKRFVRQAMRQEASMRVETRDAILWDIFPTERYCRVKVQGSNVLIKAFYPENWEQKPSWLKPKNSVRITHTGGNRNRVEIVGNGTCIPTPTDSSTFPVIAEGQNTILSGCVIMYPPDSTGMNIYITTGSYRISGVIYYLGVMDMSETNTVDMSSGVPMDGSSYLKTLNAAHSTNFRIDAFAVGSDGVIDYIVGTSSATNPQVPSIPTGHILIGTVLIPPKTMVITSDLINHNFIEPYLAQITVTPSFTSFGYHEVPPDSGIYIYDATTVFTVEVKDQYGNRMDTGIRWYVKAEFLEGGGTIDNKYPEITKNIGSDAVGTFTYKQTDPFNLDSIMIKFTLVQDPSMFFIASMFYDAIIE